MDLVILQLSDLHLSKEKKPETDHSLENPT